LIKKIKYQHQFAAIEDILPLLKKIYYELPLIPSSPIIITSVPSNSTRLSSYGYNQSEIIAQQLAAFINQPYQTCLKRRNGESQTKLSRQDRFAAVEKQYFSLRVFDNNPTVVIIDDVITTGATLSICARQLKESGAKSVWAITLAKD
jgi:ComF family protein